MTGMWLNTDEQRAWRTYVRMTAAARPAQPAAAARLRAHLAGVRGARAAQRGAEAAAPPVQICEALTWEQSRLSHQLTRMQRRGLVAREECEADGRGAFVVLTAAGADAIAAAAPGHVAAVRALIFDRLADVSAPRSSRPARPSWTR